MSPVSTAASQAINLDWNILAAAVAVFLGTLITTIFGWFKGKERVQKALPASGAGGLISGAVLQDNQSLRESTVVARELRDQLLLHHHAMDRNTAALEENADATRDLIEQLKRARRRADRQEDQA